ncbi:Rv0909 family putative TA system antitoxin [Schaalia sp. Marseille-Q2122]|uniref:Rv0909 family putative TA system antitoxin n=1 Tax=Schaalia sp. Marseille-Q2122 TaxID=2736604 RepID=UPI0015897FC8|nr:Rv0909 family putative TA system antitoxin [Schaalia sp. Marseille-Q2122]
MNLDDLKKAAEDVKDQAAAAVAGAKESGSGLLDSVLKDEAKTDAALDAVADAAKKVTGGRFDDKIDAVRDAADDKLGEI